MEMKELLEAIKAYCLENYENGFDYVVECYDDKELEEYCIEQKVTTLEEFIESTKAYREHRAEIQATAF